MERKVTSRERPVKKSPASAGTAAVEPFGEIVEPKEVKKRAGKTVKKAKTAVEPAIRAVRKRTAKASHIDPFAEVVDAPPPVKKAPAKKAKAQKPDVKKRALKPVKKEAVPVPVTAAEAVEPAATVTETFKTLAAPTLPSLERENRARLQMQSPTRLYFYWSARENPWALLRNAFGGETGSYQLVLKLTNLRRDTEEIHTAEPEGNYWFNVEPGGEYQAEIGFYAPNRPYFRVIYSNTVETPRRTPSPRSATEADWSISTDKFAEVLDVAGFSRDAFDVAMTGDDPVAAEDVTRTAFFKLISRGNYDVEAVSAEDIRYAMLSLAAGASLDELRHSVSAVLFEMLEANAENLTRKRAMTTLTEHFDIDESEFGEEQLGPEVYGASLVGFPRTLKPRSLSSRYNPLSSRTVGIWPQ